jgi:four helix bundle protein
MQSFRRLHVWERAHQFALDVRKATHSFPRTGYGELKSQLISAAESIPTNIVEGAGASSRKEFARYLDISIKSTFEVEYQLQLAKDNAILLPDEWEALSNEVVEIRRMLYGLRKAVLKREKKGDNERRTETLRTD